MSNNNEYSNKNVTSPNNHLLMYLLQNRSEEFIRRFEDKNNRYFMGVYSLYRVGYANKILLMDNDWTPEFLPVVDKGRKENQRILDYLASIIPIPNDFLEDFRNSLKPFAWFDDEDDFEFMIDGTLDKLEEMGYRRIDCKLYEAGLKFHFEEFKQLLALGANPYAKLSAYFPPSVASKLDITNYDVYSLHDDTQCHLSDSISIYGIGDCWSNGLSGKETIINQELMSEFFLATGCQLLCEAIHNRNSFVLK